ncbi:MAG TPA: hypothetical protein VNT26_21945, partial [Candidatus Sulfotelmatobacter sp.]|nr:hypothetical protein [Candidatus Sulfotelmatobacter sp.]
ARVIRFDLLENNIQNGAPDAVALVNVGLRRVMDSLSYEGAMMAATINGLPGTCNLVEGTVLATAVQDSNTVTGSLIRYPDGVDTDNANSDWTFTLTPTPGSANALTQ